MIIKSSKAIITVNKKYLLQLRDNKKNIARGKETVEAGVWERLLGVTQAEESVHMHQLFDKQEALDNFAGSLLTTMRRLMTTGIFDAEIEPID